MRSRAFLTVIFFAALPLMAQAPTSQDPGDRVVATINGEVLTVREFDAIYSRLSPQMRENYEKAGGKRQFLDTYIRRRLLLQEALKQGFDKRSEIAFDLQVARESTLFDRYVKDVVAETVLPEADVVAYYESHAGEFRRPEMIRARHIIATPGPEPVVNATGDNAKSDQEAEEKIKALAMQFKVAGGDFAEAARKFSEDISARGGGDLGWFARGKMVPAFENIAFTLTKPGETSGVVKTEFGYHVIQLVARQPGTVAPFSAVRTEIRERLLRERQAAVLQEIDRVTQELRAASRIAVYPENL